jgi:hypothetical protein
MAMQIGAPAGNSASIALDGVNLEPDAALHAVYKRLAVLVRGDTFPNTFCSGLKVAARPSSSMARPISAGAASLRGALVGNSALTSADVVNLKPLETLLCILCIMVFIAACDV